MLGDGTFEFKNLTIPDNKTITFEIQFANSNQPLYDNIFIDTTLVINGQFTPPNKINFKRISDPKTNQPIYKTYNDYRKYNKQIGDNNKNSQ